MWHEKDRWQMRTVLRSQNFKKILESRGVDKKKIKSNINEKRILGSDLDSFPSRQGRKLGWHY
jgi:hypothetical protein